MGRRDRNNTPQKKKKNSIEDTVGNEKNGYPFSDPKKTMTNVTREPSDANKKTTKEEITEKFMEKIPDMVKQEIQDVLKKLQDTKNKEQNK
jgi:hypothetical protein